VPRAVFLLLVAALLLLGGVELFNVLKRPSLSRVKGPAGAERFVLYQKGRAANREAWLLAEPEGELGPPECFQWIDCTEDDHTTGDLHWSFDGHLLYAVRRKPATLEEADLPLWVYDFKERKLWALDEKPPFIWMEKHSATSLQMVRQINEHGGKGPVAVPWYELGKRGEYLFAWQITRWEKVLPKKPDPPPEKQGKR